MKWIKIPAEHKPLFLRVVPDDERVTTLSMFGGIAMMVGGHMAAGLFADSVCARLEPAHFAEALRQGATPFDPMGNGRLMRDMVLLPSAVMRQAATLRTWLARSLAFTATLPPKQRRAKKAAKTSTAKKVAKTTSAAKAVATRTERPSGAKKTSKTVAAKTSARRR
ncbi:MAG: TfoX/Sxy family protein [Nannocystaceae bacterium]|nr:TfoX/Sxy family protein [Nannocystaceae bacterium]